MKWFKQFLCSHSYEWCKEGTLTSWGSRGEYLVWNYDLFRHECKKCGKIKYLRVIIENGIVTK